MVTLVAWHSERPCLVAVETATGKVIGAVYSSPEGWRTTNVVIEPTGTSLVVSEAAGCTSRLVRVDLRNGERTDLGPGSLAGLRSDGAALAYRPTIDDASFADEPVSIHDPCLRDAVVVRDVASGREQVLDGNDATESRVAWSPDGRFLAWNYYSNTDIGHALIVDLATGRFGHVELDDQRKPWVSDGECCGTQVLGWTSANRAIVRLDLYVASIEPGRSARSSIGTGAVRTDDRCGVCIVVDRNITRDDPDHAGDLGKAGTTTLRKWGNGWQTVGPGGVVDLPGASALWPVSATFPSFEPDSP